MGAPTLDRLIDAEALRALLEGAAGLAPDLDVAVVDAAGNRIAGGAAEPDTRHSEDAVERPIAVEDVVVGRVIVRGGSPLAPAVAELVGRAIDLAAGEGMSRRRVTAAAIDDLRELALLSRLSETIGSAVDAPGIAFCVLESISRPLGATVGLVLEPDDRTPLAEMGSPDAVTELLAAAPPVIERLRSEDPTLGSCAEIDAPTGTAFGSLLATFLRTARGHHGTIVLGRPVDSEPFSPADRQLVASIAGQAAIAIERVGLQRQIAERRVLDQELSIGRRIQISLMPRRFPSLPGWEIASDYEPAREVGGDFYDVFRLRGRGDCIGLVVADVTGKGIPAAILMADSRALIHAAADWGGDPSDTLGRVNRILVEERASGLFVTVAHGVLDATTGQLVLASAGHDPVHVLRADGQLEILDPPGRLIGMVADLGIASESTTLAPGDAFIGHTDGVTEARDPDGGFYGEDRFRALLASLAGSTASAIVDAVVADVRGFRGPAEASDDLTLLVVRRQPDGIVDPPAAGSSPE